MGRWEENRDAYQRVQNEEPNEASWGHELLGGAAAFGAMKVFEDRQRKEGKVVNHSFAKELLAGFAGAEVDKLAETKGADFVDREQAKYHARDNAERMYDDHYGGEQEYNPQQHRPHEHIENHRW